MTAMTAMTAVTAMTKARVRVKICGITRLEDATLAVRLGADAIGFVFWPGSPRTVSLDVARAISQALPPLITRVGVFVDQSVGVVEAAVRTVGLDAVQLHGEEALSIYRPVSARLIKAIALEQDDDLTRAAAIPADVTPLIDALDRRKHGGTGQLANWARAARLAQARPIILAGGLTAENIQAAIAEVRPWAVDVSSGVESAPGVKSAERLEQWFSAIAEVV